MLGTATRGKHLRAPALRDSCSTLRGRARQHSLMPLVARLRPGHRAAAVTVRSRSAASRWGTCHASTKADLSPIKRCRTTDPALSGPALAVSTLGTSPSGRPTAGQRARRRLRPSACAPPARPTGRPRPRSRRLTTGPGDATSVIRTERRRPTDRPSALTSSRAAARRQERLRRRSAMAASRHP